MAEQIEQAARTAGRTFNISLAELAGANAGQRNDLLALNQAVYRVPDGTLYTSDGAQLVPAKGLPVVANTNPLTGKLETTVNGEVVELGGSTVKSWRGLGQGMGINVQGFNGGANMWSKTYRTRHYSNASFRRVRVVLATFYPVGADIADTNFVTDYNFQVGFELDYANSFTGIAPRKMFRFSDSTIAEYRTATPPATGYIVSDILDLGRMVSKQEFFGLWTTVEAAAKAGNNLCPYHRNGSNYLQKYIGMVSSANVSQIAAGTAQSATSVTPISSTQGGVSEYYTPVMLLIETADGIETVLIDGASNSRGTGEGGAGSGEYGDGTGDARSDYGFVARGVAALGWNYINIAVGSDKPKDRMTASNWDRRLAIAKLANPTKWFNGLGRGDMAEVVQAATHVIGNTYAKPAAVTSSSNWYVLLKAGAGVTTVAPSGTGGEILCGDYVWAYVGPYVLGSPAGGTPVVISRLMKYQEMVRAEIPGISMTWHVMSTGTTSPTDTTTIPGTEIGLWTTLQGQVETTGVSNTSSRRSLLNGIIKAGLPMLGYTALVDLNDILEDTATQKWNVNGTPNWLTVDGAHYNSYACSLAAAKVTKASFGE